MMRIFSVPWSQQMLEFKSAAISDRDRVGLTSSSMAMIYEYFEIYYKNESGFLNSKEL